MEVTITALVLYACKPAQKVLKVLKVDTHFSQNQTPKTITNALSVQEKGQI